MDRRDNLGHMDFEWEHPKQRVDKTSPFYAQINQNRDNGQPNIMSRPSLPSTFGAAAKQSSPLRMQSFKAPSKSIFSPSIAKQNSAPSFRSTAFTNPAFLTPRDKNSGDMDADDSPAMTEASGIADTPDMDVSEITEYQSPSPVKPVKSRIMSSGKKSGKGDLPRATGLGFAHDRVRKRARVERDKDISGTRSRLPGGCDENDSDYSAYDSDDGNERRRSKRDMGWLHFTLSTISANPQAPIIISYYLQLFIDTFFGGLLVWTVWGMFKSVWDETIYSANRAREDKSAEIQACTQSYLINKCAPLSSRVPAMQAPCNEWETCMNQDPNSVAGVKASLSHLADIINEFTTRLSWKSIFVILMVIVAIVVANNVAFSKFRQSVRDFNHHQQPPAQPAQSQPSMPFAISPQKHDQAFIVAPLGQTPRHLRRAFFQDDTDTDASPDQRLLPPMRTPSRRSPSKGDRDRSPSKRSPTKVW